MGKAKNIVILGAFLVVIAVVYYSFCSFQVDYQTAIQQERAEKDNYMRTDPESPLPESLKADFTGLSYYPIDENYKVKASLQKIERQELLTMATNDGKEEQYIKYAYANFKIDGKEQKLLLLQPYQTDEDDYLFLAFGDGTSGGQTYGGGRYLDLEMTSKKHITLDFNLAYNPFCAYSDGYSCPLPPAENLLERPIRAGEKDFISP
ncbi:MAG: DUF1684 domain-containing protein [Cyclobacteriaceae bacterium]